MSNGNSNNVILQEQTLSPQLELIGEVEGEQVTHQHTVTVIKPCRTEEKVIDNEAIVEIDGVLVKVKIHYRLKDSSERGYLCQDGAPLETCALCGKGTWAVMRFDNPAIRKRKDYKALWKTVFFALKLNSNDILQTDKKEARKREKEWKLAQQNMNKEPTHEEIETEEEKKAFGTFMKGEGSIPF